MVLLSVNSSIPVFGALVILSLTILMIALFLRRLSQPYLIAYILAGILLGPEVFGLIKDKDTIQELGELGLILLMFFIGAEIKLPDLTRNFKKPLIGTFSQLLLSFFFIAIIGLILNWNMNMIILLSFVISLSSSAIIFQYLYVNKLINYPIGILTTGILLLQDVLVVPMLIVLNFLGKGQLNAVQLISICAGGILIILFLRAAMKKRLFQLPFYQKIHDDYDLQVFIGLSVCFGFAWLTHLIGLSSALGAFMAGIIIGQEASTEKLKHNLIPFRVFFLALFFISIGLQINITFLFRHIYIILLIAFLVLVINSMINVSIFRAMKINWRDSLYAGALLSQIGEFSFVLSTTAFNLGLIADFGYQVTLSVIMLTMIFTSIWISSIKKFLLTKS